MVHIQIVYNNIYIYIMAYMVYIEREFTAQTAWIQIFTTFLTVVSELLDVKIITIASFRKKVFSLIY